MKLISWNIQRGAHPDGGANLDYIAAQLQRLAPFDVLCLQEVASGYTDAGCDGSDQFQRLAHRLSGYQALSAIASETFDAAGRRYRLGNMLFTRLPVLQVLRHSLPWPADPSVMSMARVALEATLSTPDGLLSVTTTHLEYFSLRQRMAQVDQLRSLHAEASAHASCLRAGADAAGPFRAVPRAAPAIVVGDFNFLPESEEHARMLAPCGAAGARYYDAWQLVHPGQPHAPTVGIRDTDASTFDYVFVNESLRERVRSIAVDQVANSSAHQPVLIELA